MITAFYAGLLGLIYIALSIIVIKGRFKHQTNLGDGQNDDLSRRIRAHGNFAEYVPFALLLLFMLDYQQVNVYWLHGLCIALVISRLMHPLGIMYTTGVSVLRGGGTLLTFAVLLIASILNILFFL